MFVFDLKSGNYLRLIEGIEIPHAIFVREDDGGIYVTDGGPGLLKVYDSKTYKLLKMISLKVDADSIDYDPITHFLYIDNGGDAREPFSRLSVVDTASDTKLVDIKVDGDTLEGMALEGSSDKIYVNNAAKNQIALVDRKSRAVQASSPVAMGKRNLALALYELNTLFIAYRCGDISVLDTVPRQNVFRCCS